MTERRPRPFLGAVVVALFLAGAVSLPAEEPADGHAATPAATQAASVPSAWMTKLLADVAARKDAHEAASCLAAGLTSAPTPRDRRNVARRLADLELMLGSYADAAGHYGLAAGAIPGDQDDADGLSSAWCWFYAGEDEKALSAVARLGHEGSATVPEGELVTALVALRAGRFDEARRELDALLADPAFPKRPQALLAACILAGHDSRENLLKAVDRLRGEFPDSPEAAVAISLASQPETTAGKIAAYPSPFWFLDAPGPVAVASRDDGAVTAGNVAASAPAASAPVAATVPQGAATPARFQIGSFAKAENASRLLAELKKRGFNAFSDEKTVNGTRFFTVCVPAGSSSSTTATRLKEAGYEVYPVFD